MPTIIVEDGSAVVNANSYVDIAFADAYFETYTSAGLSLNGSVVWPNDIAWDGNDAEKTQALIVACQSMELLYGPRFASFRIEKGNIGNLPSLLWPRYAFYDRNLNYRSQSVIPIELKHAQCELAQGFLNGVMEQSPSANTKQFVRSEDTKVGSLEVAYTYSNSVEVESFSGYRRIDLMLWPLLTAKTKPLVMSR